MDALVAACTSRTRSPRADGAVLAARYACSCNCCRSSSYSRCRPGSYGMACGVGGVPPGEPTTGGAQLGGLSGSPTRPVTTPRTPSSTTRGRYPEEPSAHGARVAVAGGRPLSERSSPPPVRRSCRPRARGVTNTDISQGRMRPLNPRGANGLSPGNAAEMTVGRRVAVALFDAAQPLDARVVGPW